MRIRKRLISIVLCMVMMAGMSFAAPAMASAQGYMSSITIYIPDVPGEIQAVDMLTEIRDLQVTLTDVYELYDWEKGDRYRPDLVTNRYFYMGESGTVSFNHDVYLDWGISSSLFGDEMFLPFQSTARAGEIIKIADEKIIRECLERYYDEFLHDFVGVDPMTLWTELGNRIQGFDVTIGISSVDEINAYTNSMGFYIMGDFYDEPLANPNSGRSNISELTTRQTTTAPMPPVIMPVPQTPSAPSVANEIRVLLDGTHVVFDQPPIIENGRTLVPLRAIFEALGAEVKWEESTQTVTATREGLIVTLRIGSNILSRNGEQITLDVPAMIIGGRTLVPARAVAESFGAEVDWEASTQTVTITTTVRNDIIGAWELDMETRSGEILDFTFNADGSFTLNDDGDTVYSGTYEVAGSNLILNFATEGRMQCPFAINGNTMLLTFDGSELTYKRK